jgi:hypothetical protein
VSSAGRKLKGERQNFGKIEQKTKSNRVGCLNCFEHIRQNEVACKEALRCKTDSFAVAHYMSAFYVFLNIVNAFKINSEA